MMVEWKSDVVACFFGCGEACCPQESFPVNAGSWQGLPHAGRETEDQKGGLLSVVHENRQRMSILLRTPSFQRQSQPYPT